MRRIEKTVEELIDELIELEDVEIETDNNLHNRVRLYNLIFNTLKKSKNPEERQESQYYQGKLIEMLIYYGTFLKTRLKKDEKIAGESLKKAIKLKCELPIAYYRLGFLAYGRRDYTEALHYFDKAIEFQSGRSDTKYLMNEQQHYFAHLYLCNSALYVAEMAQLQVENFSEREGLKKRLHNVEMSPFYEQIKRNEEQIHSAAYTVVTNNGQYTCSKVEADEEADRLVKEAVVLMFSREENAVIYKRSTRVLSLENAEMLRYFFLKTNEDKPAVRNEFESVIAKSKVTGRVSKDAYRKRVSRLNQALRGLGIDELLIESKRMYDQVQADMLSEEDRELGYYYNGKLPFAVIYQTSDAFILDEERW